MTAAELLKQAIKQVCQEEGQDFPPDAEIGQEFTDPFIVRIADVFAGLVLAERPTIQQAAASGMLHVDSNAEVKWLEQSEHLNCPTCGGSGHVDDAKRALPVPEIDYKALVRAAYAKDKRWARGMTGCIAFKCGAEWYRSTLTPPTVVHLSADDTEGGHHD